MVTSVTPVPEQQHMPRAQARVGGQDAHVRFDLGAYIDSSTSTTQLANETLDQSHAATRNRAGEYCCNQQYSVTAITTSTGTIAERYAYSAYGQPTILDASGSILNASAISNRYTYTGREWDATLGLYHFRARWMSPIAGRFLGRDPVGYADGLNFFNSFKSGPITNYDPLGLQTLPPSDPRIPGTFQVIQSNCPPEYLEKGCCCTSYDVRYYPTESDKRSYARICLTRRAYTSQAYNCGRFVDPTGKKFKVHDDPPNDEQLCSSEFPKDPVNAKLPRHYKIGAPYPSLTDFPGVDQPPCRSHFFGGCPNCNELKTQWQAFEVCATATTFTGKQINLGCVRYGHVCSFSYESKKVSDSDYGCSCCSKCSIQRDGAGVGMQPRADRME